MNKIKSIKVSNLIKCLKTDFTDRDENLNEEKNTSVLNYL